MLVDARTNWSIPTYPAHQASTTMRSINRLTYLLTFLRIYFTYVRTQYWNDIESPFLFFGGEGVIITYTSEWWSNSKMKRTTVKVTRNEVAKCFLCISSGKVDQFTSNQYRNDLRSILLMSSNTFHQRKCKLFWIFVFYTTAIIKLQGSHWVTREWLLEKMPWRRKWILLERIILVIAQKMSNTFPSRLAYRQ